MNKSQMNHHLFNFFSIFKNNKIYLIILLYSIITVPGIFWGVNFSTPSPFSNVYYGDEGILGAILSNIINNYGDPNFSNWPSLFFYFSIALLAIPSLLLGPFMDFTILKFLVIRSANVVLGAFTIYIIYKIAKEYEIHKVNIKKRERRGLLAAFSCVSIPVVIYISPVMVTEPLLLFFSSLSILYLQRSINYNDEKYFIHACVYASLALATKYNGIVLIVPLLIMIFRFKNKRSKKEFFIFFLKNAFYYIIPFSIANIYSILNWEQALHYMLQNFGLVLTAGSNLNDTKKVFGLGPRYSGMDYNLNVFFREINIVPLIFLMIGLLFSLIDFFKEKRTTFKLLILSFIIIITLSFALTFIIKNFSTRYAYQSLPIFALFSGISIEKIFNWIFKENKKKRKIKHEKKSINLKNFYLSLIIIFLALPILFNFSITLMKTRDTRVVAREWIKDNVSRRSFLGIDGYVDIPLYYDHVEFIIDKLNPENLSHFEYDYLIISQAQFERWTLIDPDTYKNQSTFYMMLFNGSSKYRLVKRFEINDYSALYFKSPVVYSFGIKVIWEYFTDPDAMWGTGIFIFKHI
ncbi:MAG: ArnT family glycosyltransferase [Promethearchaeota archaeon]